MKKRILAAVLASASILGVVAGCDTTGTTSGTSSTDSKNESSKVEDSKDESKEESKVEVTEQGKVFNIYCWNDEFKNFFLKYYAGTMPIKGGDTADDESDDVYYDKAPGIPEGIEVKWTQVANEGGAYQNALDAALLAQNNAAADDKVDLFLAEADYIVKYTDSDFTMDVSEIGVTKADTMYEYTAQAASDKNGKMKGVSFQCCPAAVIYRRSIAKEVLGTDDPAKVQEAIADWSKFDAVAKQAKEKGYYMTASYVETFRTFSNNTTSAWVVNDTVNVDSAIQQWSDQAENYIKNEYTLTAGIWDAEKNDQMYADGKTMCFFGPAWYYNFSMGNAQDPDKGCSGDWAITQGPQAYFWGGTWLLAATGSDNTEMIKSVMDAFTVNEDICSALVENEMQFTNNTKVNQKFADDPNYGNAFLGGQNDTAVFVELAKGIKFENKTIYDQLLSEKFPEFMKDYYIGNKTKDEAYAAFYAFCKESYGNLSTP